MLLIQIEGGEEMPLRTELGDGSKAGKESTNLEETRGEVGRDAGIQENVDHWKNL